MDIGIMKHFKLKIEGYIYTLNGEPLSNEIWTPDSITESDLGTMSIEDYQKYMEDCYEKTMDTRRY